jgi:hypothetical protein
MRPYYKFLGVSSTKAAAGAQLKGVKRRIFFDPFLSFDPTRLSPALLLAPKLSLGAQKWSAQLSYFETMTETARRHKRFDIIFCRSPWRESELPGRRNLTQIARSNRTEQA